jgi:hypothetical protein
MAVGGGIALSDRRYRTAKTADDVSAVPNATGVTVTAVGARSR